MTARPTDLQCLRRRLTPAACIVVRERASSFIDAQDAVFSGGGGGGGPRDTEVGGHVTQRAAPSAQLAAGRPTTIAVRSGRRLTTSSADRALERFSHY